MEDGREIFDDEMDDDQFVDKNDSKYLHVNDCNFPFIEKKS